VCRKKATTVHVIQESDEEVTELFVGTLQIEENKSDQWYEIIDGIHFKLDTGSQANILPVSQLPKEATIQPDTNTKLKSYGGSVIKTLGKATINFRNKNFVFYIVQEGEPILSKNACEILGLIKRQEHKVDLIEMLPDTLLDKYKHVFSGLKQLEEHIILQLP
jgi:hypothetical protein